MGNGIVRVLPLVPITKRQKSDGVYFSGGA